MFTEEQIPELKGLTAKQKAFVLALPNVGWNESEAARRAYSPKYAAVNTMRIKTNNRVQAAVMAVKGILEKKAVADAIWTFEQARARSLEIVDRCRVVYMKAKTAKQVREASVAFASAQRSIHELNLQHGYLVERFEAAMKVEMHVWLPPKGGDVRRLEEVKGVVVGGGNGHNGAETRGG